MNGDLDPSLPGSACCSFCVPSHCRWPLVLAWLLRGSRTTAALCAAGERQERCRVAVQWRSGAGDRRWQRQRRPPVLQDGGSPRTLRALHGHPEAWAHLNARRPSGHAQNWLFDGLEMPDTLILVTATDVIFMASTKKGTRPCRVPQARGCDAGARVPTRVVALVLGTQPRSCRRSRASAATRWRFASSSGSRPRRWPASLTRS